MTRGVILNLIDVVMTMPMGIIFVFILVDEWRFSKKRTALTIVLYLVFMILVDYAVLSYLQNAEQAEIWIAMIQMASGLLLYVYLAQERNGRVFFVYFSVMSLLFVGDATGDILASGRNLWHLFVQVLVYFVIALALDQFCKKPFLEIYHGLKKGWMLLSLIPFSICFAFAYFMRIMGPLYLHPELWAVALMLCLITGCVYVALSIVFHNLKEQYEMRGQQGTDHRPRGKAEDPLSKVHIVTIEKHVDAIRALDEQITQFRHEMHHFMHMQSAFLESGDIKEAKDNLAILRKSFEEVWSGIQLKDYTGNDVIDTVLSFYATRAEQEQITMQISLELPRQMEEYMEVVVVLSNLIECAFRGCKNKTVHADKTVSLIGRQHEKEYYLEITFDYNAGSCEGSEDPTDPFAFEAGRRNIENFVKKYNGACNYQIDGSLARIWAIF